MARAALRRGVRTLLLAGVLAGCTTTGPPAPEPEARSATARPAPVRSDAAAGLVTAAGAGDVAAVRRLLAEGADVAVRDRQGRTALVAAAYGNHLEAARVLLDAGADVDAKDDTQQNAFLIATSEVGDDPRLLELALAAGADPHARDSFDGTGLIRAAERGHVRVVRRLLRTGVDVDHVNRLGWTALLEAVILGDGGPRHVETVRLLLGAGADPRLPDERRRSRDRPRGAPRTPRAERPAPCGRRTCLTLGAGRPRAVEPSRRST